MELPFAALHQLCAPMLDKLQVYRHRSGMLSNCVRHEFRIGAGPVFGRAGVVSLLSEVAEEQPLVCVVDDEQWLDRASARVLGFVARRLGAESVGLVFAARVPSSDIAGLPDLVVEGLGDRDARALLEPP